MEGMRIRNRREKLIEIYQSEKTTLFAVMGRKDESTYVIIVGALNKN